VLGDVTRLQFPDACFDSVFCVEVLEHIPSLQIACSELCRVARHDVIIGVPYMQDLRYGRTSCGTCSYINPPWGHVNRFTEERILALFPECTISRKSFAGISRESTNILSAYLMDLGKNPYGAYSQFEPCCKCGAILNPPIERSFWQQCCSAIACRLNAIQKIVTKPHATWMHLCLAKTSRPGLGARATSRTA